MLAGLDLVRYEVTCVEVTHCHVSPIQVLTRLAQPRHGHGKYKSRAEDATAITTKSLRTTTKVSLDLCC